MKKHQQLHVVRSDSGWAIRGSGNTRATSVHSTQAAAIAAAREIAKTRQGELLIHGRDGQIRSTDNYARVGVSRGKKAVLSRHPVHINNGTIIKLSSRDGEFFAQRLEAPSRKLPELKALLNRRSRFQDG